MSSKSRDKDGKLKVGYFKALGQEFKAKKGYYNSDEFKTQIAQSSILQPEDWLPDGKHKHTWRHRVDRATQNITAGI